MAGGIGGFAEGFSGGLGQGMGIIQNVRQEKRAEAEQAKRFEQMDLSMDLARKGETRTQTEFEGRQADRQWTNENMRPLQLEQTKLAVDKYKQDIKIGGVEYATKELQLKWLPKQLQQNFDLAARQDDRAERGLDWTIESGRAHLQLARNADQRQAQQQDITIASTVLPIYTQMLANGVEPPPQLTKMVANSPFGITQQLELADASDAFPKIMQSASKGDFSFMKDGAMRESAFSLARPVGMRIARERGFDATSARVTGITPAKGGGVWLNIQAFDPSTKQYRTFRHGVNANHLVEQMDISHRSGAALKAHPSYAALKQNLPGYLSVFNGDVREQAGKAWDSQASVYQKVIADGDTESPAYQQAQQWMATHGNREAFVQEYAAGRQRTQNARGDAAPGDWNRVSSTVQRYTGLTDGRQIETRANGALQLMGKLGKVSTTKIPGIAKVVNGIAERAGGWSDNPAARVAAYYEIQKNPALRAEMARALSGGQGAGNPSGGRYTPIANARKIGESIFGAANITSGRRGANDPLTKAAAANGHQSWHPTGAAFDMRPIPGMTFEQAAAKIRQRGYQLIEKKNETGAGRSKWATGDHWHFVLGT